MTEKELLDLRAVRQATLFKMTKQAQLEALHTTWCKLTGQDLHRQSSERLFYEFAKAGFTEVDLIIVITGMMQHNARTIDRKYKIQVHKVIGNLDSFGSLLADMKPHRRPKPRSNQQKVIEAFRKTKAEDHGQAPRIVGEILKGLAK